MPLSKQLTFDGTATRWEVECFGRLYRLRKKPSGFFLRFT